jgi:uncharacterized protein YacL
MLLWLLRGCFAILMLTLAVFAFTFCAIDLPDTMGTAGGIAWGFAVLAIGTIVIYTDLREEEKQIATISSMFFGLLFGLFIGWLFGTGIEGVLNTFSRSMQLDAEQQARLAILLRVLITVITCYVSISILLQTRDDFRFLIPYVEFSKQIKGGRPFVLDTSVIIDGRIADLCETRIIDGRLIVPKFVLQELQAIADSSDKLKKGRGRRGLDVMKRLQGNTKIDVLIHEGSIGEPGTEKLKVDEKLVLFAKAVGGRIITNDFNLNKIAQLQGVEVVNLNEVANSLKTVALPGEYLQVKVVKAGDQIGQGVGYLDDGTMCVIEQGRNLIGQDVSIIVTSVLQTPAGRMVFGRPETRPSSSGTHPAVVPTPSGGTEKK